MAANPTALNLKEAHIVTRPDVEKALVKWVQHMKQKQETVNSPMLVAQRERFEAAFNVPKAERLWSDG